MSYKLYEFILSREGMKMTPNYIWSRQLVLFNCYCVATCLETLSFIMTDVVRSFVLCLLKGLMSLNSLIFTDSIVEQHDRGSTIWNMITSLFRLRVAGRTLCSFVTKSKVQRDISSGNVWDDLNVLNPTTH